VKLTQYPDSRKFSLSYWRNFWALNLAGWGLLAVVAILLGATTASNQTLTCRRVEPTQVNCESQRGRLPGQKATVAAIANVQSVSREKISEGDSSLYHVVLSDKSDSTRIKTLENNWYKIEGFTAEIEQFLADDTQHTFQVTSRPNMGAGIVLSTWSIGAIGLIIAAFRMPVSIHVRLDPDANVLHLRHRYLFKTIQQAVKLEAINHLRTLPLAAKTSSTYRLELFLKSKESINLGFSNGLKQASELETAFTKLFDAVDLD
jgi:hypothetical protein